MTEAIKVSKRFGKILALDEVDLKLNTGVYGLLGPNGSGKTTLIRCLTGLLKPTSGTIISEERSGYLPQKFGMYRELTLMEAMTYFASLKSIPHKRQKEEIMYWLERVHLEDRAKHKIGTLSGGMLRRLGVAQALLGDPPLLLVDEPTAGLDPEERLSFKNLIAELDRDRTVLISTHIVEDVEAVCDHIIIIHQGKIVVNDTADGIKNHARNKVFSVPAEEKSKLRDPYHLLRREYVDGEEVLRVISPEAQYFPAATPSIEDGYMLYIRQLA